jgi:hypothetical protein
VSVPFHTLVDLRPASPYTIHSVPVLPLAGTTPLEHRFAVRWDADHDNRVLAAAAALYFGHPKEFRLVHAFSETRGTLTLWQRAFRDQVREAMESALREAPLGDCWRVTVLDNFLPPRLFPGADMEGITGALSNHYIGLEPEARPGIDSDLAALHQLFDLGSFSKPTRLWNWPRTHANHRKERP